MQDAGLIPERRSTTKPRIPEQEPQLNCPRCDSTNTKFCYYNNYNLSQPRHFCKNCRRYWTKGGALRNIPVGGGTRNNSKKSATAAGKSKNAKNSVCSPSSSSSSSLFLKPEPELAGIYSPGPAAVDHDHDHRLLDITGTFSSLLASNGQLGAFFEPVGSMQGGINTAPENAWKLPEYSEGTVGINSGGLELSAGGNDEDILGDPGGWVSGHWPDLAMYTPGSSFQ